MLKVEDLLTSVRTGGKKKKVFSVFTSHPVSERRGGGGKEEEGVLSPLVSDMRQPKVDVTNAIYIKTFFQAIIKMSAKNQRK